MEQVVELAAAFALEQAEESACSDYLHSAQVSLLQYAFVRHFEMQTTWVLFARVALTEQLAVVHTKTTCALIAELAEWQVVELKEFERYSTFAELELGPHR